jgi:hypothetical protein
MSIKKSKYKHDSYISCCCRNWELKEIFQIGISLPQTIISIISHNQDITLPGPFPVKVLALIKHLLFVKYTSYWGIQTYFSQWPVSLFGIFLLYLLLHLCRAPNSTIRRLTLRVSLRNTNNFLSFLFNFIKFLCKLSFSHLLLHK